MPPPLLFLKDRNEGNAHLKTVKGRVGDVRLLGTALPGVEDTCHSPAGDAIVRHGGTGFTPMNADSSQSVTAQEPGVTKYTFS